MIERTVYIQGVPGDNGQRKVWSTCGSTHCTYQLTSLSMSVLGCVVALRHYLPVMSCTSAWKPKVNYDMLESCIVAEFNGFMSLTS
jgi:hypothetical protein